MASVQAQLSDCAVTSTNDESTCSKKYAVSLGYWKDPYIGIMCRQNVRKTPEINRGYYARVVAVRSLVEQFVNAHHKQCQIISLGAGYDTLFWNLKDHNLSPTKYVEIDMNTVTRQKAHLVHNRDAKMLQELGDEVEVLGSSKQALRCPFYALLPADLRNIDDMQKQLNAAAIDYTMPTLVLMECVLMYLPETNTDKLLTYFSCKFSQCHHINYDVTNMSDRFAQVMLDNLGSRQCQLHVQDCLSNQTQCDRLKRCHWKSYEIKDMNEIYRCIPSEQRARIEKIEMLDEVHLLSELMMHYCICIASNTDQLSITSDTLISTIT